MKQVNINDIKIGGNNALVFIMGPCVIEDEKTFIRTLNALIDITEELKVPFIFKASYDKANRTSIASYRGPGLKKGLRLFEKIKKRYSVNILTDVHCSFDCKEVGEVVDCIQIPAYLCRQTDLLVEAGKTKKAINIKKGQFMAPFSMKEAIKKVTSTGNERVMLTERGATFGYNNLVVDFRGIPIMQDTGYPVIFDATHSVQLPSAKGTSSGGDRRMAEYLLRASVAVGVDGVFMEVHPNPDKALSDGPNSIALKDVKKIVKELKELNGFVKRQRQL